MRYKTSISSRNTKLVVYDSSVVPPARHRVFSTTPVQHDAAPAANPPPGTPYSSLTIGVPTESFPNERRVAMTPANAALLLKKGFKAVLVQKGAGAEASFTDADYKKAGATLVDGAAEVFAKSDVVLKVRPPTGDGVDSEAAKVKEGATVISFLYPGVNKGAVEKLKERKATSFGMELVPRISRAQVFDALRYVVLAGYITSNLERFELRDRRTGAGGNRACQ